MDKATDISATAHESVKKVVDGVNTVNSVVNSPEVNIVGDIAGGETQKKIKSV